MKNNKEPVVYSNKTLTKKRIDWDDVKADYVMGIRQHKNGQAYIVYPTLADLAEKYDTAKNTMAMRSRNEKWVLQREMFKEKISQYREQSLSEYKIRSSTQFDSQNVSRLEKIGMILDARLTMYKELYGDDLLETIDTGDYNIPDIKEVNETLDAIGKLHVTMRNVIGEPLNYYEAAKTTNREIREAKQTIKVDEVKDLISTVRKELNAKTIDVISTEDDSLNVNAKTIDVEVSDATVATNTEDDATDYDISDIDIAAELAKFEEREG